MFFNLDFHFLWKFFNAQEHSNAIATRKVETSKKHPGLETVFKSAANTEKPGMIYIAVKQT